MNSTLSKSQYIKGLQCPKALWFYRHRKDLKPPVDKSTQARLDTGHEVGEYAKHYFGQNPEQDLKQDPEQGIDQGIEVDAPYWDIDAAVAQTQKFIRDGEWLIFEATAMHPANGAYARIDILRRVQGTGQWDLIEVKSTTGVKDYHYNDLAFQYYVFAGAGYEIGNCYMMLIDNTYVRQGEIQPRGLLKLEDITGRVKALQGEVAVNTRKLTDVIRLPGAPDVPVGNRCSDPFVCDYRHHCWKNIPDYSVYNVFPKDQRERIAEQYSPHLEALPKHVRPSGVKGQDMEAYLRGKIVADTKQISAFLKQLDYPLYFLDYESMMPAVPIFNNTRPYQNIPFQFSLHIQAAAGNEVRHYSFLHKERSDPRPAFAGRLLELCGKTGSIVVYNRAFEQLCNRHMAEAFPEYADGLLAVNERMVDLLIPFRKRYLYHPDQNGSASLKAVLPCFTDANYDALEISGGEEAMNTYVRFAKGLVAEGGRKDLWKQLETYCKLDTYAMVLLSDALRMAARGDIERVFGQGLQDSIRRTLATMVWRVYRLIRVITRVTHK